MKLAVLLVLSLCGCAHLDQLPTAKSLIGEYSNHDGFWPRTLTLHKDGSFTYDQLTDVLKEQKDGTLLFEGSWGMSGKWSFQSPDRVELVTEPRKDHFPLFVRRHSNGKIVLLEPHLFPDILKTWTPSSQSTFTSQFLTR